MWKAGDEPTRYVPFEVWTRIRLKGRDSFFVIEKGILRAAYSWPPVDAATTFDAPLRHSVQESMLPGTVAGDHTFLSATPRNTDVIAERDALVWKMDLDGWERLVKEQGPEVRGVVAKGLLRMASEEQQVLMGHLFTTMT